MTSQFRLVSGANIFDFAANGWHVPVEFVPPATRYTPIIATGVPSADYPGGDLIDEFIGDVAFNLPLLYKGDSPNAARRALEIFVRRGVSAKNLQLQERQDRAFAMTPLWGQWGAWQSYEIIHAGSLTLDGRTWEGYDGVFADLPLTCKPAVTGQAQQIANAKGAVSESFGADGLSEGVTIGESGAATMAVTAAAYNSAGEFTFVFVWERGSNSFTTNHILFIADASLSPLSIYYNNLTTRWYIDDGGGTTGYGAAVMPSTGELLYMHVTGKTDAGKIRVTLYVNGAAVANIAATISDGGTLYVGTDQLGLSRLGGTFHMMATYDAPFTAAEVAADYADIVAALSAGPSPSPIPYAITLTGVGRLDNATDASGSTGAPHRNYAWLAGIPGSLPAKMELRLAPSVYGSTCKRLAVSLLDYDDIFAPEVGGVLYEDVGGTANAGSSSGSYTSTTIDTTFTLQLDTDQADAVYRRLQGRELAMYARLQSGTTGAFQIKLAIIVGSTIISAAKNVAKAAAFRMVRTPFLALPKQAAPEIADTAESSIQLYAGRSTGSGAALFDWGMVMPRPLVEVDTSAVGALTVVIYENTANRAGGSGTVWATLPRKGDVLRPLPHRYNLLTLVMGDETVDPLVTWYSTATVTVIPRWSVI